DASRVVPTCRRKFRRRQPGRRCAQRRGVPTQQLRLCVSVLPRKLSGKEVSVERTLKSSGVVLALFAVAALFPRVPPAYAAAIGSAGFLMFGLVALRPVVRTWVGRRTVVEGTVVLGSEDPARRFYEEFAERERFRPVHMVDYDNASDLADA